MERFESADAEEGGDGWTDGLTVRTNTNFSAVAIRISPWHCPQILKTGLSEHTDWDEHTL